MSAPLRAFLVGVSRIQVSLAERLWDELFPQVKQLLEGTSLPMQGTWSTPGNAGQCPLHAARRTFATSGKRGATSGKRYVTSRERSEISWPPEARRWLISRRRILWRPRHTGVRADVPQLCPKSLDSGFRRDCPGIRSADSWGARLESPEGPQPARLRLGSGGAHQPRTGR